MFCRAVSVAPGGSVESLVSRRGTALRGFGGAGNVREESSRGESEGGRKVSCSKPASVDSGFQGGSGHDAETVQPDSAVSANPDFHPTQSLARLGGTCLGSRILRSVPFHT